MIDQSIVNWIFGLASTLIGFLLSQIWQAVKDLQKSDRELADKISSLEVLVAGQYVKETAFNATVDAMFKKLDRIEDKIDKKADKSV